MMLNPSEFGNQAVAAGSYAGVNAPKPSQPKAKGGSQQKSGGAGGGGMSVLKMGSRAGEFFGGAGEGGAMAGGALEEVAPLALAAL